MTDPAWTALQPWFSEARLARYLADTGGDTGRAAALYAWNAETSGAFLVAIHHVEVLLRNAVHRSLDEAYPPRLNHGTPWYMNPDVVSERSLAAAQRVVDDLAANGQKVLDGRVIAGLHFGFWSGFFSRQYEGLWRKALHAGFLTAPVGLRRQDVARHVFPVGQLRNRIAHHERIVGSDLDQHFAHLFELAAILDTTAAIWIVSRSRIPVLLSQRP